MGLRKLYGFQVPLDLARFPQLSRRVASAARRPLSWNKSLVGEGVFTHEAGIHVDGLLKDPRNYQGVDPAEVGRQHRVVLGKHSGMRAVQRVYQELGFALDHDQACALLIQVRAFVGRVKRVPDGHDLKIIYQAFQRGESS